MQVWSLRLARVFQCLAQGQKRINVARELLVDDEEYSLHRVYKALDSESAGYVSVQSLLSFLSHFGYLITHEDAMRLIHRLEVSSAVHLSYEAIAANFGKNVSWCVKTSLGSQYTSFSSSATSSLQSTGQSWKHLLALVLKTIVVCGSLNSFLLLLFFLFTFYFYSFICWVFCCHVDRLQVTF